MESRYCCNPSWGEKGPIDCSHRDVLVNQFQTWTLDLCVQACKCKTSSSKKVKRMVFTLMTDLRMQGFYSKLLCRFQRRKLPSRCRCKHRPAKRLPQARLTQHPQRSWAPLGAEKKILKSRRAALSEPKLKREHETPLSWQSVGISSLAWLLQNCPGEGLKA